MNVPPPALLLTGVLLLAGCEREERRFQELAPSSSPADAVQMSDLHAGEAPPQAPKRGPYQENAWAIAEGQRLFLWFNCVGCHGMGGGGSGPALMDNKWRYGSAPENIYATIVEGRPNGMPSFRGKIPQQQVWQLVAYVRSLSGLVPLDAAPGRSDTLSPYPPNVMRKHDGVPPPTGEKVEHPR